MNTFLFFLIITRNMLCLASKHKGHDPKKDALHHPFKTLEAKSTTLYKCSEGYDGIECRVPKFIECPMVTATRKTNVVTLW